MTTHSLYLSQAGEVIQIALKEEERLKRFEQILPWKPAVLDRIYSAKILDVDKGLCAAFLDLGDREGFLRFRKTNERGNANGQLPFKPGQNMIVQVHKMPAPGKRIPCSNSISLAGFHTVFRPHGNKVGFSRRFAGDKAQIRKWFQKLDDMPGGWLFRSSVRKVDFTSLERECRFLYAKWLAMEESYRQSGRIRILEDAFSDPVKKTVSDCLAFDLKQVMVDSDQLFEKIMNWAKAFFPYLCDRIHRYSTQSSSENVPLFAMYGLEKDIRELSRPKIWLKNGGYLLFNQTDAMFVIDVNSGKAAANTAKKQKTNLQAAEVAARQVVLRNMGGLIAIDFINLKEQREVQAVEHAFVRALGDDAVNCQIEKINSLGVLCLSRRRRGESLWHMTTESCSHCQGAGFQESIEQTVVRMQVELQSLEQVDVVLKVGKELHQWLQAHRNVSWFPAAWRVEVQYARSLGDREYCIEPR
ncbi:MAG: hypothetical protein CR997_11280 [Acidobacteria bacterium]|nr:MAG: hypothetical protein CR997_11280 [Acidobacteriota bacterium]